MTLKTGFAGPSNWPCCGVTSVATVAEVPFATVLEYMRTKNDLSEGWKGASSLRQRLDALDHFGVQYKVEEFNRNYDKVRFWKWALLYAKPNVTYMVDVCGHTVSFKDQFIIDQANPNSKFFARAGNIGNMAMVSAVEILSIPSKETRQASMNKAASSLAEMF